MNKQQLEISLPAAACVRRRPGKFPRPARAQWWFEQMRRAVEAAASGRPAPKSIHRQAA